MTDNIIHRQRTDNPRCHHTLMFVRDELCGYWLEVTLGCRKIARHYD